DLRAQVEQLLAHEDRNGPLDRPVWVPHDFAAEAPALNEGDSVGPYRVEGTLGTGGMGEGYRVRDTRLGRVVALKVRAGRLSDDPERRARFQREAQILAALNHPHIAAIHGVEETATARALVLEFVAGESLAARLARSGALVESVAIDIALQIADALAAAHL